MKLEDIQNMWVTESVINYADLGHQSLDVGKLHGKYLNIYSKERLALKIMESDLKKLFKLKFEYYMGIISTEKLKELNWEPNQLKILRQDLPLYLNADKDLSDIHNRIILQQEKVDFLTDIIKHIAGRGYLISSAIQWEKFMGGS